MCQRIENSKAKLEFVERINTLPSAQCLFPPVPETTLVTLFLLLQTRTVAPAEAAAALPARATHRSLPFETVASHEPLQLMLLTPRPAAGVGAPIGPMAVA